jgi:lysozyme
MAIKGIDVSWHNGSVDWAKVKAAGVNFVFIKATQGTGYAQVDYFRNNAPKAAGFGLNVGAYHYGTFSNIPEALAEAKYFLSVVKDYKLTYPLVLDLEENKKSVSKKQLTDAAIAFMEMIKHAGYQTMLYTNKSFLDNVLDESLLKYPLWISRYYKELGCKADIWQYSDQGQVNGISGNVDVNWAYRDFAPKPVVKPAVKKPDYPGNPLRKGTGDKGHVKLVQSKLHIAVDGIFGNGTEKAIKNFQSHNHLTADGIIGPKTWAKMF